MNGMKSIDSCKFQQGRSGNPAGRPKGAPSGRAKAINALDRIVGSEENIKRIEEALEDALRKKPIWFFINSIMPLLPKEAKGVMDVGDHVVEWRSLVSVGAGSPSSHTKASGKPSNS